MDQGIANISADQSDYSARNIGYRHFLMRFYFLDRPWIRCRCNVPASCRTGFACCDECLWRADQIQAVCATAKESLHSARIIVGEPGDARSRDID